MAALKENDVVEITQGEYKGKSGTVTAVIPNKMRPNAPAYHEYSVLIRTDENHPSPSDITTTVEARHLKLK